MVRTASCSNSQKQLTLYSAMWIADEKQDGIKYQNNDTTSAQKCAGGGQKGQYELIDNIGSQNNFERNHLPLFGVGAVIKNFDNLQKQFSRLDCPITLNPKIATFDDVALHALLRQRLSPGTVEKRMRYARFMEKHKVPVDFRNPSFENFVRHMDYREQTGAGYAALRHEWDAMKMFLRAYGIQE